MKRKQIIAGAILVVSVLLSSIGVYFYQSFFSPNLQVKKKKEGILYIPQKATFDTVLDSLQKHEMIGDVVSFAFVSKILGYKTNIKAGRYIIQPNMTNYQTVKMLRSGSQSPIQLSFHNLRLKEDFAQKMAEQLAFEKEDLLGLLNDSKFCQKYQLNSETILTLFLPNTYEIYWDISPEKFVEKMYKEYQKFWNKQRKQQAKAQNMSPTEVSILASIVEAETNKNDEKTRVAGVYTNRLKKEMLLQADPTVKFALQDFTLKRILFKHLEVDSPYNTYKYQGLPPGPINMPSLSSIEAVLKAEKHEYLFFCAKEDFSGYHNFATNETEHRRNARRFHQALNQRGIK